MLGNSQRLPPAQLPSREVGKGWGLGNEQEWGGGRSSLESPGVCASVRLCVCVPLCMTGVGGGLYKHYEGAHAYV